MGDKNEFSLFRQSLNKFIDINVKNLIEPFSVVCNTDNFNLLPTNNDTVINLDNIQNIEESHSKLFPYNKLNRVDYYSYKDDSYIELINKKNFFNDCFFQQILLNSKSKDVFEKINSNMDFNVKLNGNRTNSSQFFFYQILKELNKSKKEEEVKQNLINKINSLSPLQKENISLISNIYQVPDEIKTIKYYRKVKPNGDSFYISFIYQYIKHFLLKGDNSIISRIINLEREYKLLNPEQEEKQNIESELGDKYINETCSYNFQNMKNLGQALFYLSIIYSLLANQKNEKDYKVVKLFNWAFAYDKFFSRLLTLFVKTRIKKFLKDNYDKFDCDKYCQKNKLINSNYFFPLNKKFDYELYLKDNLFIDQMEPSLFIISIIPYIFNITLNLYINEESLNELDNDEPLTKIVINPGNTEMTINILYSSFSYHIIENMLIDNDLQINIKKQFDICNIFNYTQHNAKIYEYQDEYIKKITKEKCKKCNNTDYIIIKNVCNNYPICSFCFRNMVDNILINRYKNMLKEKFKFVEFYLKEIPLIHIEDSNNYINLSSTEFFYIFNQNLFTYFRNLIKGICDLCGKFFKNKKIINKKCGCKRCIDCAKKECNIIYFNNFEKKYIKFDLVKCKCGKDIEKNQYASQIYNMLSGEQKRFCEKKAKDRIKDYYDYYCMQCGKKFGIEDSTRKINFENIEHKLCENCFYSNNQNKNILCVICNKMHIFKEDLKPKEYTNKGTVIIDENYFKKSEDDNKNLLDNIDTNQNEELINNDKKEEIKIIKIDEIKEDKQIETKNGKETKKIPIKKIIIIEGDKEGEKNSIENIDKKSEKYIENKNINEIKENVESVEHNSTQTNSKTGIKGNINMSKNEKIDIKDKNSNIKGRRNNGDMHCCIIC